MRLNASTKKTGETGEGERVGVRKESLLTFFYWSDHQEKGTQVTQLGGGEPEKCSLKTGLRFAHPKIRGCQNAVKTLWNPTAWSSE
jgi:hypothetical protein